MLGTILLVASFILFLLGSFWYPGTVPNPPGPIYGRLNLVSLGLALWVLSILLGGYVYHH